MGLPQITFEFKTKAASFLARSERGVVALILKDDTGTFDSKEYKTFEDVAASDWTADNYDYIQLAFNGSPNKVIVEREATISTDYAVTLARLESKKFNYLAVPSATDASEIVTWIKSQRSNNKTFKAVVANTDADDEGIINFASANVKTADKTYTTEAYSCRIAGVLAGLPLSRSATYYVLDEVVSITEHADPDTDIDAGKLILMNDGEKIKIARGVNSLTTIGADQQEDYKKIKIIEGMDIVKEDIISIFNNNYVGQVVNDYDNKQLFIAAVNNYLYELIREGVLDKNASNLVFLDLAAQKDYLKAQGVNVDDMKDTEIKKANTGSQVFVAGTLKFVDAIEDLTFSITV